MNMDLSIPNKEKELYYYFWFVHYALIIFLVLGIIVIYKNNNTYTPFILVIVIVYITIIFIQNNGIIKCFYNKPIKEGWRDTNCFQLYSGYATAQMEIDQIDISYNALLKKINDKTTTLGQNQQSQYLSLTQNINTLLKNSTDNLSKVAQTNNAWNSQYAATLQSMNNMTSSLNTIKTNLDPHQYTQSYTVIQ